MADCGADRRVRRWSPLPGKRATKEIIEDTKQMKLDAEKQANGGKSFPQFLATLYRSQVVDGMNYVVKVNIGAYSEVVHVQYRVSKKKEVNFTWADKFNTNDPLDPYMNSQ